MASNIKIVGNILSTTQVSRYSDNDINLISSRKIQENFGGKNDYIEYYVYDIAENLLSTNYNYLKYKLPSSTALKPGTTTFPNTTGKIQTENVGIDSTLATPTSSLYPVIEIDPIQDLQDLGYSSGEFKVRYNLFQTKLSNYIDSALFIKEISQDRTEIRLASITLTNDEIESITLSLINEINNADYYVDYLLNFGDNKQYVAVNVALNKAPEGYEVLFKLYQPLPLEVQEKQTLWVVEEIVNPYVFDINLDKLILPPPAPTLRGPNFDIETNSNQGTVASSYTNYSTLISSIQSLQNSSYNQILNLLTTQSVNINVDYTDYNNFIFFGSAYQRVSNFYTKVQEIEDYQSEITQYSPYVNSTASLQTIINKASASITDIISQFDGYETYLYFESNSYAWPKSNSSKPFTLSSSTSTDVIDWYNNTLESASYYDLNNYNNLEYAVPNYVRDDVNNQPFLAFLNMVGQYFDNIWVYLKAIPDINVANNNLNKGISKDLVYERLRSLGLKLYNSQAGEEVNQFLIGANTGSSVWDNDTTITGSYLNNIPRKDLVSELYKRIYHNLPYLLKTKGTVTGLNALITTFGLSTNYDDTVPSVNINGTEWTTNNWDGTTYRNGDPIPQVTDITEWYNLNSQKKGAWCYYNNDPANASYGKLYNQYVIRDPRGIGPLGWKVASKTDWDNLINYYGDTGSAAIATRATGSDYWNSNSSSTNKSGLTLIGNGSRSANGTWTGNQTLKNGASLWTSTITGASTGTRAVITSGNPGQFKTDTQSSNIGQAIRFVRETGPDSEENSILNIREYGGGLKSNLIKGYNNDKVRIVENTITGSVLSPILSLQTFPTASNEFRENDSHYIDISFSPQTPIDNYISGAIASNNPSWSLDDYIGDPRQQYSSSYVDLEVQRKLYFETGVSGYAPLTASSTWTSAGLNYNGSIDYNGFIRLVEYFDNSLFKMLEDFVPERASLSTGVTINSPVLERNKAVYPIPSAIQNTEYTAEYSTSSILTQYGTFYNALSSSNNTMGWFDGELSGSIVDINQYFEDNYNPYLQPTDNSLFLLTTTTTTGNWYNQTSWPPIGTPTSVKDWFTLSSPSISTINFFINAITNSTPVTVKQISGDSIGTNNGITFIPTDYFSYGSTYYIAVSSGITNVTVTTPGTVQFSNINLYNFQHSDWNVLLNNISKNRSSLLRKKVDWIYGTTGSILVTASLQDSYESLTSYQMSRHDGVQLYGQRYNTFTGGDITFGKDPVIERNSLKFAWTKNIPAINKNFYDKTSIIIKYLVDEKGSLNELSQANRNLFEVQNIFKTGTPLVVSLTDPQKYSNQVLLNGDKSIFDGGFSYSPILYRENNDKMTFQYTNPSIIVSSAVGIKAISSGSSWITVGNGDVYFDTPSGLSPWYGSISADISQIQNNISTPLPSGIKYSATINSILNWDNAYGNRVRNINNQYQTIRRTYTFQTNNPSQNPYVHDGNNQYWPQNFTWPDSGIGGGYWSLDLLNFVHTGSSIGGFTNGTGMANNLSVGNDPNGEKFTVFTSPKPSNYKLSLRVPLSIRLGYVEPWNSVVIIKVLCVVEKKIVGSNTWTPLVCSTLRLDSPLIQAGNPLQGVDPNQSTIWFGMGNHNSAVNVTCILDDYSIQLNTGDQVRIKPFLVELYNLFIKTQNINFIIRHDGGNNVPYLQIIDINNSTTSYSQTGSIAASTGIYTVSGSDNKTIAFTPSASLFYNQSIYLNSGSSVSDVYTSVDDPFTIQAGDVMRFGSFYTKNATLYNITNVFPPQTTQTPNGGTTVNVPLSIRLDKSVDTSLALSGSDFAILRRKPDETSIIINFLKNSGETSQALLIPNDLLPSLKEKAANVAASLSQDLNQL